MLSMSVHGAIGGSGGGGGAVGGAGAAHGPWLKAAHVAGQMEEMGTVGAALGGKRWPMRLPTVVAQ